MQHTIRQSSDISSCTHKISENTTIKTNSDTNIMLKDDQNSIQVKESTCQAEWYTMVSVCMWSDQNNHGKIRVNMLSKAIRSINIIGMSISQTNISMKHRRKHGIGILNQDKSVNIINMSKSQMDITSKHASKNPQCTIKRWASTDRPIEWHVCFTLSSSLTL